MGIEIVSIPFSLFMNYVHCITQGSSWEASHEGNSSENILTLHSESCLRRVHRGRVTAGSGSDKGLLG